jgi:hypothetical protein
VPSSWSTSVHPSPSPSLPEPNVDHPASRFLTPLTLYEPSSLSSPSGQIHTHSNSVDIRTPNISFTTVSKSKTNRISFPLVNSLLYRNNVSQFFTKCTNYLLHLKKYI